jgi:hypothetical protein
MEVSNRNVVTPSDLSDVPRIIYPAAFFSCALGQGWFLHHNGQKNWKKPRFL